MADTTNTHELLVSTFATADALAKLLIEKSVITQKEFMENSPPNARPIKNFLILRGNEHAVPL